METKFTPGPWTAALDGIGDFCIAAPPEICAIAAVVNGHVRHLAGRADEHEANAHLIAAAPDLYEACKLVVEALDPPRDAYRAAVAALTKARGETEHEIRPSSPRPEEEA